MTDVLRWSADFLHRWRKSSMPELAGLYVTGSAATGTFQPTTSDVDLVAVVDHALTDAETATLVDRLDDRERPPGRGLDLDIFTTDAVADFNRIVEGRRCIRWSTGNRPSATPARLAFGWALDLALTRERGIVVTGPVPQSLISPVPAAVLLCACRETVAVWAGREHFGSPASGVLNACRAWLYWTERRLGSKLDGGRWVRDRTDQRQLIDTALTFQSTGRNQQFDDAEVRAFMRAIQRIIEAPAPVT